MKKSKANKRCRELATKVNRNTCRAVAKAAKKTITRQPTDELIAMVLDREDDKLLANELAGRFVDKLAYQVIAEKDDDEKGVKKGDVLYQDLTVIGIKELARNTIHFHFGEPKETFLQTEDQWVVRVECTNTDTNENAWGSAEVGGKYASGKYNKFPYRQAVVKAQRNALKMLIPHAAKMLMFETYLRTKQGRKGIVKITANAETIQKALPEVAGGEKLIKGIFAKIHDLGLDSKRMHYHLKKQYKTEHLRSLTETQLKEIKTGLDYYKKKENESKLFDLKANLEEITDAELKEMAGKK